MRIEIVHGRFTAACADTTNHGPVSLTNCPPTPAADSYGVPVGHRLIGLVTSVMGSQLAGTRYRVDQKRNDQNKGE